MPEPHYKRWYKTARWQRLRAEQLQAHPLCAMCKPRITPATVCDHVKPHRGDETAFWSGPFQSLCAPHHNSAKQREERAKPSSIKRDADGWPILPWRGAGSEP